VTPPPHIVDSFRGGMKYSLQVASSAEVASSAVVTSSPRHVALRYLPHYLERQDAPRSSVARNRSRFVFIWEMDVVKRALNMRREPPLCLLLGVGGARNWAQDFDQ
jgi:hypothetical protein